MVQAQHIVVVDDEQPAREMVGDYLRMHGFTVNLRDGGASLRTTIAQQVPDLIVLDLNMRGGSGRGRGPDDYLAKPCELRELLARIRVVLRRSAPPQQPAAAPTSPAA